MGRLVINKKDTVIRRVSTEFDERIKSFSSAIGMPSSTATKYYTDGELISLKKKKKKDNYVVEAIFKKTFTIKKKKGRRTDLFDLI